MKVIKGDWIMEKNEMVNEDLKVEGNILGKDGKKYNLVVKGDLNCSDLNCGNLNCRNLNCWSLNCWDLNCRNLNCWDLNCLDLNCLDLDCRSLNCRDLNCRNLNCWDLNCRNLNCRNLNFFAVAITYSSFKCKSWKARRDNFVIKCLDGEIEGKEVKT